MKYIILILTLVPAIAFANDISVIRGIYNSTNQAIKKSLYRNETYCIQDKNATSIQGSPWAKIIKDEDLNLCNDGMPLAKVYFDNKIIKKVKMLLSSPGGDWSLDKEFYYYDNGNIAFIFYSLSTTQGYDFDNDKVLIDIPYTIEHRIYFGLNGQIIKTLKKAFSQVTGKSIPEKYLNEDDIENYLKVSELPTIKRTI